MSVLSVLDPHPTSYRGEKVYLTSVLRVDSSEHQVLFWATAYDSEVSHVAGQRAAFGMRTSKQFEPICEWLTVDGSTPVPKPVPPYPKSELRKWRMMFGDIDLWVFGNTHGECLSIAGQIDYGLAHAPKTGWDHRTQYSKKGYKMELPEPEPKKEVNE